MPIMRARLPLNSEQQPIFNSFRFCDAANFMDQSIFMLLNFHRNSCEIEVVANKLLGKNHSSLTSNCYDCGTVFLLKVHEIIRRD